MNFKKIIFTLLISTLLFACKKDVTETTTTTTPPVVTSATVNTWIHQTMSNYYFWSTKMPALSSTNVNIDPMKYFTSILYDYGNTDRFSWIDSSSVDLIDGINGFNKIFTAR